MSQENLQVPKRLLRAQRDILTRYDRISNLWVAYHNSGKYPDDFGREFYYAIGKLLQGAPVSDLPLHHLDPEEVEPIVEHTKQFERALSGANGTMTDEGKGTTEWQQPKRRPPPKRKPRRRGPQPSPNKRKSKRPAQSRAKQKPAKRV
jgi:hypothetical protein